MPSTFALGLPIALGFAAAATALADGPGYRLAWGEDPGGLDSDFLFPCSGPNMAPRGRAENA